MRHDDPTLRVGCHGTHATTARNLKRPLYAAANRVREEIVRLRGFAGAIRHVHGPRDVECGRDELVVLCLVRDAELWIQSYLEHHLALGAKHVFLLDNGSQDGTIARASRFPRVSIYRAEIGFKHFEVGLRRWLTRRFGWRRWSLAPDADELWDYPCSDRLPLREFLRYLDHHGYKAVVAHALDMFSDVPFSELVSRPEDDLRSKYRYYDLADIVTTRDVYWIRNGQARDPALFSTFGGVRERFFGTRCLCQTRHALHFADGESHPYKYDGHFTAGARVADVSTVLLHYKFVGTLYEQAKTNLALGQHHGGSANYRGFVEVLERDPRLTLRTETARELRSVNELVDRGLLHVSASYREWVERYGRRPLATGRRAG